MADAELTAVTAVTGVCLFVGVRRASVFGSGLASSVV